jgi:hypothetical protein
MPRSAIFLEWFVLDEQTGWCDSCALPSLVVSRLVLVDAITLRPVSRARMSVCTEHCTRPSLEWEPA